MALIEEKVLASVEVLTELGAIQVKWVNRIIRDGEMISQVPHRCAYGLEQKDQFITDIEDPANGGASGMAAAYIVAVGW